MELWTAVLKLAEACGCEMPNVVQAVAEPAANGHAGNGEMSRFMVKATDGPSDEERAIKYMAASPPAISKRGGHAQLFRVTRAVRRGFVIPREATFELIKTHYNPRCEPPWPDADLWHKVDEAETKPFGKPWGWLRDQENPDWNAGDFEEAPDNPKTYTADWIDSATFAGSTYKLEWLVGKLLVRQQPILLGGPRKSLKTSIVVDLVLSLGTARPFLGVPFFTVPRRVRVALLSGESGQAVLQETAKRVAAAKGVDLADADVFWGFHLPRLSNPADLAALGQAIDDHRIDVLVVDPLYLALLAGLQGKTVDAANLFDMGPLLLSVAQTCLQHGCTPLLIHHARKALAPNGESMELEDLAYSGIQEFARQWLLINRREKYEPGSGVHKLWLSAGGSAGQGGQWAINVTEGELRDDFTGWTWIVEAVGATQARQADSTSKREAKETEEDSRLLGALDVLDPQRCGASKSKLAEMASLSGAKATQAIMRLIRDGVVEMCEITVSAGRGKRPSEGFRRARKGEGPGEPGHPDEPERSPHMWTMRAT
jgi:replicative DNA helicase